MADESTQMTEIVWRHCRWFESHPAVPVPGSVGPVRAMGGRIGAECETCHEALVQHYTPVPDGER